MLPSSVRRLGEQGNKSSGLLAFMFVLSYCALRSGIVPIIILQSGCSVHTNLCWQLMLVVGCMAEGIVDEALSIVMPTISGLGIRPGLHGYSYLYQLLVQVTNLAFDFRRQVGK